MLWQSLFKSGQVMKDILVARGRAKIPTMPWIPHGVEMLDIVRRVDCIDKPSATECRSCNTRSDIGIYAWINIETDFPPFARTKFRRGLGERVRAAADVEHHCIHFREPLTKV